VTGSKHRVPLTSVWVLSINGTIGKGTSIVPGWQRLKWASLQRLPELISEYSLALSGGIAKGSSSVKRRFSPCLGDGLVSIE